ncbi:MAG: dienelactone hydrolase family protein [Verrucomicrobiales bacterium]
MNDRRTFLRSGAAAAASFSLGDPGRVLAAVAEPAPRSVAELWADFDPRRDPVEAEVIREWREDGGVFRHVRYLIGTVQGKPARMVAIYGFPEGAPEKLPAVMHIHGGGQRAFLHEVKFLVGRGYAALSVNWGGNGDGEPPFNSPDRAEPGDPNTDWGAVDPSQLNVQGYGSMLPGPKQFYEDREHPKNCNWYLLALGCRRGLTFLEQQPEVDPGRLGVHGYSMGGNLTMFVAGTDDRVKAAVPGVGGSGWRWQEHRFLGGTAQQDRVAGDVEVWRRTLSFESYAPLIKCPVLHRSGTNDFHGWMDDVYRTNALIPGQPTRYCWAPHLNHRLIPEVAAGMPLWFDHFLKGGPALPETPATQLVWSAADRIPVLRVIPDANAMPAARVEIYYSVDPDPRARFWRSADASREGEAFAAKLPLHTLDLPLFAFANVYHTLPEPVSGKHLPGEPAEVREICLSSLLHRADPDALAAAGVAATAKVSALIDDFSHGLRDWYQLNAGNPTHQQTWTRKVTDPMFRGADGAKLALTLTMPKTNRLSFVVHQNEWRSYRGPRKTFACNREIQGGREPQTIVLEAKDFVSGGGEPLPSWSQIDQFGICARFADRGSPKAEARAWDGPAPEFRRLEWA